MAPTLPYQLPALTSPLAIVAIVVGSLLLVYCAERFVFGVPKPIGIPLLREPEGARHFSLRTRLAYYTDCKGIFREAYENVREVFLSLELEPDGRRSTARKASPSSSPGSASAARSSCRSPRCAGS